jgi:nucleosome assembly protein 1-like 1
MPAKKSFNFNEVNEEIDEIEREDEEEEEDEEDDEEEEYDEERVRRKLTKEELEKLANDAIAALPEEVQTNVKQLQTLQQQYSSLKDQFVAELLQLHLKYDELYTPIFEERRKIVNVEPNGIPQFWRTVLSQSELGVDMIQERDLDSLNYITDVRVQTWSNISDEDENKRSGFTISFYFAENPYFTNSVLTKKFFYDMHHDLDIVGKSEGTTIDWKSEEQNLTLEITTKKQRHKSGNRVRKVKKSVPCDSFYNFFSQLEGEDDDEDLQDLLDADTEIGEVLKDSVIPHAMEYYLGLVPVENEDDVMANMGFNEEDIEAVADGRNGQECRQQ